MKKYFALLMFIPIISLTNCTDNDDELDPDRLSTVVVDRTIEKGGVIACAASSKTNADQVLVFFYPKQGATDFRLYETTETEIDEEDYGQYTIVKDTTITDVFNGYLKRFEREALPEKWVIITYELEEQLRISNPIRLKRQTKATVWSSTLTIDQNTALMPKFTWATNTTSDNEIYFQVVTDTNNNLLSGTYTTENTFQYYNTGNVTLNITENTPPALINNENYNFTLMDISKDNWVNRVIESAFIAN